MDEQTAGFTVKNNVIENAGDVWRNRNGEDDFDEKTIYINKSGDFNARNIIKNAGINKNFDAWAKLFY